MKKQKAIPDGYMTVGELAKKMNTTVRTLQYYDKEGLLSPSAESEGGRRLYTEKDIIHLHQIQSMKYLGFSLYDIKYQLVSLDTPQDVATVLTRQIEAIREDIESLSNVLHDIQRLQEEILQIEAVDWTKYADIIVNLQMKNEFYGVVKHFDKRTMDHLHKRFDWDSGTAVINAMNRLIEEAIGYQKDGIVPDSEQGQNLAKAWWDMITEATGGDLSLLSNMTKGAKASGNKEFDERFALAEPYLEKVMEVYFTNQKCNPLEGVEL